MGNIDGDGKIRWQSEKKDQGVLALVLDLAKAFGRVSLPVVWAWATHFSFPRKILRVLCGYFEHQRHSSKDVPQSRSQPSRRVEAELPALTELQNASSEVTKFYFEGG